MEPSHLPAQYEPVRLAAPRRTAKRAWPRPRPPGRPQLAALVLALAVILFSVGVPSPAAAETWLPPSTLTVPHLPSLRLPSLHPPAIDLPTVRVPTIRMPHAPSHPRATPSPSLSPSASRAKTPTPRAPTPDARYRAAATAGVGRVSSQIDDVERGCTAPANLAVCRAALTSLQSADAQVRSELDRIGTPACLSGADPRLRAALDALDAAAAQSVAGIDGQDPGRIVDGVQSVGRTRAPLTSALQDVQTAAC